MGSTKCNERRILLCWQNIDHIAFFSEALRRGFCFCSGGGVAPSDGQAGQYNID